MSIPRSAIRHHQSHAPYFVTVIIDQGIDHRLDDILHFTMIDKIRAIDEAESPLL
jgi:hypothetical protein